MSVPAGGGRRRRRRTGCFLGAQQGTRRPSVWGGGPEPSSGAAGRPSCPTCLTFHPEPPPVHRTHADNGSRPNRQIISYITSSQIDLNRQEITLRVFFPSYSSVYIFSGRITVNILNIIGCSVFTREIQCYDPDEQTLMQTV